MRSRSDCAWLRRAAILAAALPIGACERGADAAADASQISRSGRGAYEVSLARHGDGAVVAWYDTRNGNAEIYLRALDRHARPDGGEQRLTQDSEESYEVDVDAVGDGVAVAWYGKREDASLQTRLGLWVPQRGWRWAQELSPGLESRNPVVRGFDDRIFCAWIERAGAGTERVMAAWWHRAGAALRPPVVLAAVGPTTWNLNAAVDQAGDAYVVFDTRVDGAPEELFLARLDGAGRVETRELTAADGARSKYPDLAVSGTRVALTWYDERDGNREVYLFAGTLDELASGPIAARARRVTTSAGESIGAYVAWNLSTIGLAWSDDTAGAFDVYFEVFDATGAPLASPEPIARTRAESLIPAIEAWDEGFLIAWNEVAPGSAGMHDPATRSEVRVAVRP